MISIKNIERIKAVINNKKAAVTKALETGLRQGLRQYEAYIITDMLNGRKTENYGLNARSGIARNSLDVKVETSGGIISGKLFVLKRAWYLKVHQHDEFNGTIRPKTKKFLAFRTKDKKWIMTKSVYIPKRLYMYERFRTRGNRLISLQLNRQIERL